MRATRLATGLLGVVLAFAALALVVSPARAADALYLTWNQCGPSGDAVGTFDCNDNTGANELYCAFSLSQTLTEVLGVDIVVDVQHSAATLPDWWRMGVGGCRYGQLDANGTAPAGTDCMDFWLGEATDHGVQSFAVGQPRGGANQARIRISLALLPASTRSLTAGNIYYAAKILLGHGLSTGTGACAGCAGSACLVLNSITIRRLQGAVGGDVVIETPAPGNGNFALWQQADGLLCGAVPTRQSTWGRIKALYR